MTHEALAINCLGRMKLLNTLISLNIGIVFIVTLLLSGHALAHSHDHEHFEDSQREQLLHLLEDSLEIDLSEVSAPLAVPTVKVGSKRYAIDGPLWQLIRGYVDVYRSEIVRDCDECQIPTTEVLFSELQSQVAKGFLESKVIEPLGEGFEHIVLESAQLRGRYGRAALNMKIAAEIAEWFLSKAVGGGGVHFLCSAIDAGIVFFVRGSLRIVRVPYYRSRFSSNVLGAVTGYPANLLRGIWIYRAMNRVRSRVQFAFGPVRFDPELIKQLDREGPNRFWGFIEDGKRAQFLKGLDREIARLELPQNREIDFLKRYHRLMKLSELREHIYRGHPLKRFLWLKRASRGYSKHLMRRQGDDERDLKDSLWIVSAQDHVLHKAIVSDESKARTKEAWLQKMEEYSQRLGSVSSSEASMLDALAVDIASRNSYLPVETARQLTHHLYQISNPKIPRSIRYLYIRFIEDLLGNYSFQKLEPAIHVDAHGGYWSRLRQNYSTIVQAASFGDYVYNFTDHLMGMALVSETHPDLLKYRLHSIETFFRIHAHIHELVEVLHDTSFKKLESELSHINSELTSWAPWSKNKRMHSWLNPWAKPYCEDL